MSKQQYKSKSIDHLGLISGLCKEIGIVEILDSLAPKQSPHSKISFGQLFLAMILNGLGFVGRTLHMYPQYFEGKPLERLIGSGVKASHINDDSLGRCLDTLYDLDVSSTFQKLSKKVISHLELPCNALNLDSTSMHVDGKYESDSEDINVIKITKGYSRDHRPELNQVIINLITENQAGIPVYMQACSGNTNDSEGFKKIVKSHISSLKEAYENRYLIGDAALYTQEIIQSLDKQKQFFITRVPQKIKQAKNIISNNKELKFLAITEGYKGCWIESNYAEVVQKWLVIKSEQAYKREIITLDKKLKKESSQAIKDFEKLSKQQFGCETDAMKTLEIWKKKHPALTLSNEKFITEVTYLKSGRPKNGDVGTIVYFIEGNLSCVISYREKEQLKKGIFILSSNDCSDEFDMLSMLENYKSQQSVERGFRFLKSPDFLTSSLFLKKPERIEALLMVMTSCLMIYAALEHLIRKKLKEKELYFQSMKNKPTQKPTARWVFQCFAGIDELCINEQQKIILNLKSRHEVILNCLGQQYWDFYS
jgi:transposase